MEMFNPPHPGEILSEEILKPLDISIVDAASHLGITRKTLSKIIHGRGAITPEMAFRLEKVFGNPSASVWLGMQNDYDLWQVRQNAPIVTPFQPDAA
ncbi:HigA family addiction module antitoxin [Endozoicomonas sp. SCSIO W0465]|uniref:HigA family addiction module antitoxin n=1 Tax=Endozoicomonas sp. SCSIO W0465 TaxID=2918516 RepID=UPI0020764561|nr:HigA family addiction module antitoxin [Endozoicomonas sp. SCSIO W0465]USE36784.1 HigA family addiction module antitoxin [Endozoicomonas sp. SCSIO W0465]